MESTGRLATQHTTRCSAFAARPRVQRRASHIVRASVVELPPKITKVTPKGDLVLAKVAKAEEKTTGGVLLPGSAQKKPTSGDIIAVGDGRVEGSKSFSFTLQEGDTIVYSKFGFGITEFTLNGEQHRLLREDDVIGVMPRRDATAEDVPELKPIGDRILVKVDQQSEVTLGGVILPDSAEERPLSGVVVRTGPGKMEDGKRKPVKVSAGDRILYFKYAGDPMETPSGEKYTVLHESDILCKQK